MGRKLIVCIVPRGKGEAVAPAAMKAGAGGGTVLRGRGTAPSTILHLLGFGEKAKDVALVVVDDGNGEAVRNAILGAAGHAKPCNGALFTMEVGAFWKSGGGNGDASEEAGKTDAAGNAAPGAAGHAGPRDRALLAMEARAPGKNGEGNGNASKESGKMNATGNSQLITVIVNQGLAEDAMAAARKAGASGGTIIEGTGTAKEDDATFFGVRLVPEKELLLIHVEEEKADAVYEAIRSLPCFAEKGVGIVFRMPVRDFTTLDR